jgi:hypothetical protein
MLPNDSPKRPPKGEDTFILGVASGRTLTEAAKQAGISHITAQRRMADPSVRRRISELRSEMLQSAMGRISGTLTEAVDTLRKLLKAKTDTVKLGAARALLEYGLRFRETLDLEERLAQVEAQLTAGEPGEAA